MSAAILTQGLTTIRDALASSFSPYVYVSDDSTAFSNSQTSGNPAGGSTIFVAKSATIADIDAVTYTATITINGTTDSTLTGKKIYTVGVSKSATNTDAQSRSVRTTSPDVGIGVQAGDIYTIGVQVAVSDQS